MFIHKQLVTRYTVEKLKQSFHHHLLNCNVIMLQVAECGEHEPIHAELHVVRSHCVLYMAVD